MPITAEQRAARTGYVGSSDAPAILGVDPWRSPYDVWMEKVYGVEDATGEHLDRGNDLEPLLVEWAARQLGKEIETYQPHCVDAETGILCAHPDAVLIGGREGIEAKSTNMPKEYGTEGTDQVPERVIVQAHVQMHCAGLEVVWVPVFLAEFDRLVRRLYRVERDEALIQAVVAGCVSFWREHVEARVPPSGSLPSAETLKRLRRQPGSWASVDPELVVEYERRQHAAKEAELMANTAKLELVTAAGDAEGIDFGDPTHVYTYHQQKRPGIDRTALILAHPAIAEEFATCSTFRVLRRVKR